MRSFKTLVHGGSAAAGIGTVNNVVVNQRGGLEQLHRHARLHNGPGGAVLGHGRATRASPTPVAQQGAQALAAGGEGLDGLQQGQGFGGDTLEQFALAGKKLSHEGVKSVQVGSLLFSNTLGEVRRSRRDIRCRYGEALGRLGSGRSGRRRGSHTILADGRYVRS